jgi:tetratricopeptide (TPR) repeat protein
MRFPGIVFSIAAFFVIAGSAIAASQREFDDCAGSDPDRSIAVYTGILQGRGEPAKNDAIACNNRGLTYRDKGELDRAIADFNEAIRLDPKFALAYNNRGLAYRDGFPQNDAFDCGADRKPLNFRRSTSARGSQCSRYP